MNKRFLIPALIALLSLTACTIDIAHDDEGGGGGGGGTTTDVSLDFYNLNDFHGATSLNGDEPGMFLLSSYLKDVMSDNPDYTVFTNSGDMWQGSADSNLTKGALVTEWLNYLGCEAMAIGNHEFDWKISQIIENEELMNFPMLACNIFNTATNEYVTDWVQPYTTITRGDIKIGIIGAIGEGITGSILADNVRNLAFLDPMAKVAEYSTYLRENENCDVILFLYHEEANSLNNRIAEYVDAVFLGHSHQREEGTYSYGNREIPYVQGWSNGKAVGHIRLNLKVTETETKVDSFKNEYIYTTTQNLTSYNDDPGAVMVYESYAEQIDNIKNREVARLTKSLDQSTDIPFYYNRYACRYYDDVLNGQLKIAGCVTNTARAYLNYGTITYGDVYKSLPFDNALTLMYISGARLAYIAENYSASRWYIPHVSTTSPVDNEDVRSSINLSTNYYFLAIDYVSTYDGYSSWMNIVETYNDDDSMPRNIFSRYIGQDFPL